MKQKPSEIIVLVIAGGQLHRRQSGPEDVAGLSRFLRIKQAVDPAEDIAVSGKEQDPFDPVRFRIFVNELAVAERQDASVEKAAFIVPAPGFQAVVQMGVCQPSVNASGDSRHFSGAKGRSRRIHIRKEQAVPSGFPGIFSIRYPIVADVNTASCPELLFDPFVQAAVAFGTAVFAGYEAALHSGKPALFQHAPNGFLRKVHIRQGDQPFSLLSENAENLQQIRVCKTQRKLGFLFRAHSLPGGNARFPPQPLIDIGKGDLSAAASASVFLSLTRFRFHADPSEIQIIQLLSDDVKEVLRSGKGPEKQGVKNVEGNDIVFHQPPGKPFRRFPDRGNRFRRRGGKKPCGPDLSAALVPGLSFSQKPARVEGRQVKPGDGTLPGGCLRIPDHMIFFSDLRHPVDQRTVNTHPERHSGSPVRFLSWFPCVFVRPAAFRRFSPPAFGRPRRPFSVLRFPLVRLFRSRRPWCSS